MSARFSIAPDFDFEDARACGTSGMVYDAVIKVADFNESSAAECNVETEIYKRLGRHPRIIKPWMILGGSWNLLIFERMSCNLREYLSELNHPVPQATILKWADQLAEGFNFIHEKGVYQTDVSARNVLLDRKKMDLKLCDFAGSSLDGQEPLVWPSVHAQAPWLKDLPDRSTELFSMGSLYYEMCTRHEVYHNKSQDEAEKLINQGQLPSTSTLVLDEIIQKCWNRSYAHAGQVREDIALLQCASAKT